MASVTGTPGSSVDDAALLAAVSEQSVQAEFLPREISQDQPSAAGETESPKPEAALASVTGLTGSSVDDAALLAAVDEQTVQAEFLPSEISQNQPSAAGETASVSLMSIAIGAHAATAGDGPPEADAANLALAGEPSDPSDGPARDPHMDGHAEGGATSAGMQPPTSAEDRSRSASTIPRRWLWGWR